MQQQWEAAPICLLEVAALRQGRDPLQAGGSCDLPRIEV